MTDQVYFPRFAKDGTDRAMRVLNQEHMAGKRAPYHLYYRKNGKPMVDPVYRPTPQDAIAYFKKAMPKAEVLGVIPTCLPDECNLTY